MVRGVGWVLWAQTGDWENQWDQLGAMGSGLGDWDSQWGQMGAMGSGLGVVNRIHWVLWGRDGGGWDPQWDQLGAMGPGLGVVNRIHWVLWGRHWWDWVGVQGVAWHHMGVKSVQAHRNTCVQERGVQRGG